VGHASVHYYVEIFRCTPLLVQIVWFYFALPIVLQIELPDWFAAGLGLTSTWARSPPRSSAAASSRSTRASGRPRARSA
jgi:amine acid ABC transporter, permease protein, 3-TM region, His/Glu/Gln/Arg/opine family